MSDREIEIQVKVEKIRPLLDFLKKHGQFVAEQHQIDEYFSPIHRDFICRAPGSGVVKTKK